MIVSENEVYQIVKKSCISEKVYEDWADDIGKAIALLQKNNMDGCEEFKNLIKTMYIYSFEISFTEKRFSFDIITQQF